MFTSVIKGDNRTGGLLARAWLAIKALVAREKALDARASA